ncbi:Na+/H+ antiporter family protein [Actinobacillus equuli]|uniref:Na+/H+ antiporter family protein n=1 Tax=Actinobacillus equuli TaxID=718 RepID=UPI00244369A9|nr:Na+/H+ antiporter family protein [Actinobacillus equuli]WGE46960.1 Na+/H+ antiporter family protein [Actinobacillus equuli subsp. haemolyticus]WGE53315.1 Na+/H+ antiporter family protein [Actinobacillus equuli subsp. haemolyticus]WGE73750.1 Na+/H+ antiporter family protein [Actinobacillus equuli subsp. haemolyticus]WGE81732.1 Na+/H+ antiporter family protein [Actinobacillus equuli subsp. haemolyticus]WGE85970.1 Na+/H+ antiporter family protein [Actinobacillus equuli subsp. haemolyticus]
MFSNEVVISIIVLLALSLLRINVVIALIIAALTCGVIGFYGVDDMSLFDALTKTIEKFTGGLGGGAETAMNYAVLGAFAVALSKSGVTDLLAYKVISAFGKRPSGRSVFWFKYIVLFVLTAFAISSQNLIPIHIAFIPILVPPLLSVMNQLKIDRRAVACALTFGLTATYMLIPAGFGQIFIESILVKNINQAGQAFNLVATTPEMTKAMAIPVSGMILGLLFAFFVSYRKPRVYVENVKEPTADEVAARVAKVKPFHIGVSIVAIIATCSVQLATNSTVMGGLVGLIIFALGGVFKLKQTNDLFQDGLRLMAMIGFVMIAASGFASVVNATGGVPELVETLRGSIQSKEMAALLMLVVGLFITMGIGSSFSTVPIITSIYVPLCVSFGFSPLATMAIVGVAAALGDAGSPASDSTLGPTSGLNADGKHDHIWDSVVPTFLHFNIPLLVFGWIAAMTL